MKQKKVSKQRKYRPEIDGLRAIAVIFVIFNHINKDLLPNGYLGVDIFFVISGYVITSSIYGRTSKDLGDFLLGFYSRRLKRLIPALTFFLITTSFAISLFCDQPTVYLKTALTASFGVSNIYLYQNSTNYFATNTALNPFTQTWSLGVEQQFYLFFPILAWISGFSRQTKNGVKIFLGIISCLAVLSLISFLYLYKINQPAAYFLVTSRFWEMATGCLFFIGSNKNYIFFKILKKIPSTLIAVLMILIVCIPSNIPSLLTVAIVALSSIFICSLEEGTNIFNFLTKESIIYIGLISYSLYLWHWGILSLAKWTLGISTTTILPILLLILFLSVISYRFFEIPLRKIPLKNIISLILGSLLIIISSLFSYILGRPFLGKLYLGEDKTGESRNSTKQNCPTLSNDLPNFIIVGDSHAYKLHQAFKECIPKQKLKLATVMRTAFPRVNYSNPYILDKDTNNYNNLLLNQLLKEALNPSRDKDLNKKIIIIANRSPIYFSPSNSTDGLLVPNTFWNEDYSAKISNKEVISAWVKKLNSFAANNSRNLIYVLLPPPEINTQNIPLSICKKEWFRQDIPNFCHQGVSMLEAIKERKDFYDELKKAESKLSNIKIYDSFQDFCDPNILSCKVKSSGKLMYIDSNHLSSDGYDLLINNLITTLAN